MESNITGTGNSKESEVSSQSSQETIDNYNNENELVKKLLERIQQLESEKDAAERKVIAAEGRVAQLEKELQKRDKQENNIDDSSRILPKNVTDKIKQNMKSYRESSGYEPFDLSNCLIEDWMLSEIVDWIRTISNDDIVLDLTNNKITNHGIKAISSLFHDWKDLCSLDISGNVGINDELIPHLIEMVNTTSIKWVNTKNTSVSFGDILNSELGDEIVVKICDEIKGYENEFLNFSLNEITISPKGLFSLLSTLRKYHPKIVSLDVTKSPTDNEYMKVFGAYVQDNEHLESLAIGLCDITDKGVEILASFINYNSGLKTLQLSRNEGITDASKPLLKKIMRTSNVKSLICGESSIVDFTDLNSEITIKHTLTESNELSLERQRIGDIYLILLCEGMSHYDMSKLKSINLFSNNITLKGASVLLNTLKECNSVVSSLELSNNQLDDECMKQLGEYLQDNEYVKQLGIGYSKITDKGVEILSEYLIGNTRLRLLHLHVNKGITDASVPLLIEIAKKSCISKLDLRLTLISTEKKQEIDKALSIPIDQREIPIKSNTKSATKIQ